MILDNIKNFFSENSVKNGTIRITRTNKNIKKDVDLFEVDINYNNKIRQIINYLCENKESIKYEFLILLSDEYFIIKNKIFPSKKFYIKKLLFPGKLIIEKYSNLNNNNEKYSFKNNPMPNELYIKLPKEQVYVLYSEFEYQLLESKLKEFYSILKLIGTKNVKISKIIKNLENTNTIFSTEVKLDSYIENINVTNEYVIKNEDDTMILFTQELNFNNNDDKDPDIEQIINNNYFYLPTDIDLQSLIIRRIENNKINDMYTYVHHENNLISKKTLTKLNKFKIGNNSYVNFDYSLKKISNFQIEYVIEYNEIKNRNINKIYLNEYKIRDYLKRLLNI